MVVHRYIFSMNDRAGTVSGIVPNSKNGHIWMISLQCRKNHAARSYVGWKYLNGWVWPTPAAPPRLNPSHMVIMPSDEECHELREEDSSFSHTLELYMSIYKRLRMKHVAPFSNFWCDWWTSINDILPRVGRGSHSTSSNSYVPSIGEIVYLSSRN